MEPSLPSTRPFPFPVTALRREAGARGKFADVLGIRPAYDDAGAGPPVVCLHAIGHGARDFAALSERLRSRFRVVALDFPDHGGSDSDSERATASRYAMLVEGFLAQAK